MSHDVFVSYSNKDKVIADSIVAAMEQNGIRCWYAPRDIKPGEDWGKSISSAIEKSRVFLVIFSNYANRSQRVLDEVNLAISNQAVILPFRIENLEPDGALKLHLSSRHWLDAYEPSWESHIKALVKNVSGNLETNLNEGQIVLPPKISRKIDSTQGPLKKIITGIVFVALAITAGWYGMTSWLRPADLNKTDTTKPANVVTTFSQNEEAAPDFAEQNGVLDLAYENSNLELDPQKGHGENINLAENLFLSLTNFNLEQGSVSPEAAESWGISTDGKLYTFKIRQDIPWVTHALGGETTQVLDEDGNKRFVSARDFEYAIKRMCNSENAVDMASLFTPLIKGCQDVFNYQNPDNIPEKLYADIGVRAISDSELLIELTEPSAYFLTMTALNPISAIPQWAFEKYGDAWKNIGTIITNGYYVIGDFKIGESIHLTRNNILPADMAGGGNIGRINILLDKSIEEAYQLWNKGLIDFVNIPDELFSKHKTTHPDEFQIGNDNVFLYFSLNHRIAPFDNVHVRRAFAASLDKVYFIETAYDGNGLPINHFGLPGLAGASSLDKNSLNLNVDFAREELALGGYPNCEGLPQVIFYSNSKRELPEEIFRSWEKALGCEPGTIKIVNQLQKITNPAVLFLAGWQADIPDMQNLMTIIHCGYIAYGHDWLQRDCAQIDTLIEKANIEVNINKRSALYAQIEEACFGLQGEFPVIPVMVRVINQAVHKWLETDKNSYTKAAYYDWIVDMKLKQTSLVNADTPE